MQCSSVSYARVVRVCTLQTTCRSAALTALWGRGKVWRAWGKPRARVMVRLHCAFL